MEDVRQLTDEMVIAILDKRVELETENEAEMIDFIREVMARGLWVKYDAQSIFDFMTRAHYHYAPAVAQRKIDAARAMQALPQVKELMLAGEINLTQLGMLMAAQRQKPVSIELQAQVLEAMRGQTILNTQILINEAFEIQVKTRTKIRIQRDGSVRVEVTYSKEEWEMMERTKEAVSHSVPSGDLAQVNVYCARFTLSKKDHSTSAAEVKLRHCQGVRQAARRFVFSRDQACRHRHADGSRCGSRYQLQVDHVISLWRGGHNGVENLQLLCGVHNRYKYELEKLMRRAAA